MKRFPRSIVIAAIITVVYVIGLAFNLSPWLRGPDEWRWAYALPATLSRLWLSTLLLIVYILIARALMMRSLTRRTVVIAISAATLMTPALQLALLYMDHPDVRTQLFYRTVSELSGGYFNVGAVVTDVYDFLRHFVEHMPAFPLHPQTHPPGLPLLFAWGRLFFDQHLDLASSVSAILRPYQCGNLPLMNLPNSAIASATVQMSVPILSGLIVWPLYRLGRAVYDEATALRAALLWPLLPSVALWATRWDPFYALFTVLALIAIHFALSRRKLIGFLIGGLVFSMGLFFTFGNVIIALLLGLYALIWLVGHANRPGLTWLLAGAALFAAGAIAWWIALWLIYGLDPIALWRTAVSIHLGLERSYITWLFFDVYDFLVFMGIVISVLWIARVIKAARKARAPQRSIDVLTFAFVAGLLVLDLSGTSRGEVARLWAFLLPLPLLGAMYRLPSRPWVFTSVIALLALQVFVGNIFLRPVGTGLSDPPAPPPDQAITGRVLAQWQNGITLQAVTMPVSAARGATIPINVTWTTTQSINRPYTIFVHLIDTNGNLVAQDDGMPLDGRWPTTCWQMGHGFDDRREIKLPDQIQAGLYRVRIGFYWLPTNERAPVAIGAADQARDSVELGTIEIN